MPEIIIVCWRDIPAQVIVKSGRKSEKRELPARFMEAIDACAMRTGMSDMDAYLAEWRRQPATPCGEDLAAAADQAVADLSARYDVKALKALIDNAGHAGAEGTIP